MFLDTSGLLCFHHRAEPQHAEAVRFFRSALLRLTHSYVVAEFVALAQARGLPREAALSFIADLDENVAVQVVCVSEARGEPSSLADIPHATGAAHANLRSRAHRSRWRTSPTMAQLTFPIVPAGLVVEVPVNLEAAVLMPLRAKSAGPSPAPGGGLIDTRRDISAVARVCFV
jgi:predicted nucleic acid-binding protein